MVAAVSTGTIVPAGVKSNKPCEGTVDDTPIAFVLVLFSTVNVISWISGVWKELIAEDLATVSSAGVSTVKIPGVGVLLWLYPIHPNPASLKFLTLNGLSVDLPEKSTPQPPVEQQSSFPTL